VRSLKNKNAAIEFPPMLDWMGPVGRTHQKSLILSGADIIFKNACEHFASELDT
jgi:hypothetical protein